MSSLISGLFGNEDTSARSSERTSAAANRSAARTADKNRAFLRQSKLVKGGGISTSFDQFGRLNVSASNQRLGRVGELSGVFKRGADLFGGLRSEVRPGFSRFRETGLSNLRDSRRRVVGDLKDNLARRRIAGSSFASDAVSRAEAEFQKREDEFSTQTFLQELDATSQLISKETELNQAAVQTFIDELNLEADVGLKLSGIANAGISQIASAQIASISNIATNLSGLQQEAGQNASDLQQALFGFAVGGAGGIG